ncbi:FMN-binding glutamate synthase family protein [Asticcacaulis sp. SL142]|uniref:FMN-binding glutamate synthase family protein n=1 Tax=Asticcacaulis sp. SL142 TaxID=2995155 RepID=UPI00226D06F3|nr:FMN-binding glutamate synthase family protein [Asticcacaulis sp. SL142]WAC48035.1 FMN-binding glutamate synthase family protein [Asticcacaulis sp. SL142]
MGLSRFFILQLCLVLTLASAAAGYYLRPEFLWPLIVLAPLSLIGIGDLIQSSHAILRNYPIIGHFRFILEALRPEIRQYMIEDDRDPLPFSREQRALVYRRAKNVSDKQPFGTIRDVNAIGYGWISHSMRPSKIINPDFRIHIGGRDCLKPYAASVLNISGTSFGAVSANAIMAFNKGAKKGGFAHNTGEGAISKYHTKYGGDLIWQIASGYFGCRTKAGRFDPDIFAKTAALDQVKMIELKLSQGAKPGHGGVLPKNKITAEIARTRLIDRTKDCVSPAAHPEFATPREMMRFIAYLRDLSGGKPVGLKLAVGHRSEFLALVKAMLATGVMPDFITIDGGEGGTGAAPVELANHVGLPLVEGLSFVHNALVGAGLRDQVRIGASGKIVSAFDFCRAHALGADFVMSARAFMFAAGCIQARSCHTNHCPTGVATQSKLRQRALVVSDKAPRVENYHRNTLKALAQMLEAAGLNHPRELKPWHLHVRATTGEVVRGDVAYHHVEPGSLLNGTAREWLMKQWHRAQIDSFDPVDEATVETLMA